MRRSYEVAGILDLDEVAADRVGEPATTMEWYELVGSEGRVAVSGRTRVYVDMVGDLFHLGHVELLRQARAFGDWLVVGVLADDVVAAYKRRPVMTLDERVAVIRACRYVDEVVPNAPDVVSEDFLATHDISLVVHGDDISEEAVERQYGDVAAAGKLRLVRREPGISTTDIIRRVRRWDA